MSHLGDLIQAHIDRADYPPSVRMLAAKIDISPTALGNWRTGDLRRLPDAQNLRAAARVLGVPYAHVLRAALLDTGYLKDEVMGNAEHPAPKSAEIVKLRLDEDPGYPHDAAALEDDSDPEDDQRPI